MVLNPFFILFVKMSLIIGLARVNEYVHQPISCALGYTAIMAALHYVYAAAMKMPLWLVGAYLLGGLLWGIYYFRKLSDTESGGDRAVIFFFGGFVLLAF